MFGTATASTSIEGLLIQQSEFSYNGGAGLTPGTYGRGIQIDRGVKNTTIQNNRIVSNLGVGIENGGGNYDGVYNEFVQILTNYFYGNPVYAIDVGQQKGCVITGNTIDNSTGATSTDYGIFMESVVPTSRSCSIAHNIVRNAGTFGIYIAGDNRFIDIVANDVGAIRNPSVVGAFHIVSNSTANIVANIVHGEDDGNAVEGIGLIGVGSKIQGSISANQIFSTFRDIHVDGTDDVSVSSNLLASTTIMAGTVLLIGPNATGTIVTSNDITGVPVGAQNWIIDNGGNSFIQQLNKAANAFYFLNQNIGIATSTPQTALDVNGLIRTYQTSTTSCSTLIEGAIFYNATAGNKHFFGCDGTNWKQLDN